MQIAGKAAGTTAAAEMPLENATPEQEAVMTAIGTLIAAEGEPRLFSLCDADRETRACIEKEDSLSAFGVGGLLLPLVLEVDGVEFIDPVRDSDGGWQLSSDFDLTVNEIPPFCPDADGTIALSEAGTLRLSYDAFYCNWVVIGNVITQIDFYIDRIDVAGQSFTGEYAIQFNGTGNAFGSGYFRADLAAPEEKTTIASRTAQ
ncbi:MAG: hypothetical protein AAF968_15670 [Pseudomonadota bacterium]